MKKLLFFLVSVPIICFSQGDFRKMNWGESESVLKRLYPEINFNKENNRAGLLDISHSGKLIGIDVRIVYSFYNDSLVFGAYTFKPMDFFADLGERLNDFDKIQDRLYEKYPKNIYNWEETSYEDYKRFRRLDYKELEGTLIRHLITKGEYPTHYLWYSNYRFREIIEEFEKNELNDF
tara:strand:- start:968 stop:1501 length:534 start_codon:yes stop_codon:yes gene_type:complete